MKPRNIYVSVWKTGDNELKVSCDFNIKGTLGEDENGLGDSKKVERDRRQIQKEIQKIIAQIELPDAP